MVGMEHTPYASYPVLADEVVNNSFSENALRIMRKRYFRTKPDGAQETPAEMLHRIAHDIADVERNYGHDDAYVRGIENTFFGMMARKEFTPAGRTITNAGAKTRLIANCVVLPIHDSMASIFETLKDAALLQQAGCGLGFALDELRPAMSPTVTSEGSAGGPVSFLHVYNEAFGTIKQQGRHGANMAMMSVDHPDILDFIEAKMVEGTIANFNISVKVTDEFMDKAANAPDELWYCTWNDKKVKPQRVFHNASGVVQSVEAIDITVGELLDKLVEHAWLNGEPGIVFIDEVNRTNPLPGLGPIQTSNPCAEQFLHPYDNCNLGSINLAQFVKDKTIDEARLRDVVRAATRFLDNVIDRFDFPVEQLNQLARRNRRIGLGIMGFADMLYQLGVSYHSERGRETARRAMRIVQEASEGMSEELAKEKGAFPNYDKSVFSDGSRRNAALTTIAPTGTISMFFDTSSGVEPNFALSFIKQDKDGDQYSYLNVHFRHALEGLGYDEERIRKIQDEVVAKGTIQHMTDLPKSIRDTFVTAMDIAAEDHIRMQAAFQSVVDNSISKTINLLNGASRDDVKQAFMLAWNLKAKSCTVYRDGSRQVQILTLGKDKDKIVSAASGFKGNAQEDSEGAVQSRVAPRKRPDVMRGATYKMKTGYGTLYVTVNDDEFGKPFEVFATIGKTGGFMQEQGEAICRLISLSLRSGIDVAEIIDHLKGIRGPMPAFTERGKVYSLPDAIAQVLEMHGRSNNHTEAPMRLDAAYGETIEAFTEHLEVKEEIEVTAGGRRDIADHGMMPGCPDCGEPLQLKEGCIFCPSCGYSRCD